MSHTTPDGHAFAAKVVRRECPTELHIYVPVNPSIRKAIVVLKNPHNHPMYPKKKPTHEDDEMLHQAMDAAGLVGLTPQSLMNGASRQSMPIRGRTCWTS